MPQRATPHQDSNHADQPRRQPRLPRRHPWPREKGACQHRRPHAGAKRRASLRRRSCPWPASAHARRSARALHAAGDRHGEHGRTHCQLDRRFRRPSRATSMRWSSRRRSPRRNRMPACAGPRSPISTGPGPVCRSKRGRRPAMIASASPDAFAPSRRRARWSCSPAPMRRPRPRCCRIRTSRCCPRIAWSRAWRKRSP